MDNSDTEPEQSEQLITNAYLTSFGSLSAELAALTTTQLANRAFVHQVTTQMPTVQIPTQMPTQMLAQMPTTQMPTVQMPTAQMPTPTQMPISSEITKTPISSEITKMESSKISKMDVNTKTDVYNAGNPSRYNSDQFYGVMIDTGASKRSTAGYSQFQAL